MTTRTVLDPALLELEQRLPMGYEEWATWAHGTEFKSEWVNGEVIVFVSTSIRHALIGGFLFALLRQYADFTNLGQVFSETVEMRMATTARVPDILFVKREHLERLTAKRLFGPADLVVELVSDESVVRDQEDKFREYAAAGVPEYWLLDSRADHQGAAFYHLIDGAYRQVSPDKDGRYRSVSVPGFWFRPAWLWQEPLPNPWPLVALIAQEATRAALAALDTPGGTDRA